MRVWNETPPNRNVTPPPTPETVDRSTKKKAKATPFVTHAPPEHDTIAPFFVLDLILTKAFVTSNIQLGLTRLALNELGMEGGRLFGAAGRKRPEAAFDLLFYSKECGHITARTAVDTLRSVIAGCFMTATTRASCLSAHRIVLLGLVPGTHATDKREQWQDEGQERLKQQKRARQIQVVFRAQDAQSKSCLAPS